MYLLKLDQNGDTIWTNTYGSYLQDCAYVLCAAHDVPFTVAAPRSTIDRRTPEGGAIPIEQRSRDEVARLGETVLVEDGIPCRHPAFDVTPARLVRAIYTERGVLRPAEGLTPDAWQKERAAAAG